uniref:Bacterial surface antigen (D15) domain-containing protein n=1 Tax=Timema cristinae TaxID=61476 RepID=A0A7R9CCI3_TIMCR|nr:unnamed protein product [Timema cristinae]
MLKEMGVSLSKRIKSSSKYDQKYDCEEGIIWNEVDVSEFDVRVDRVHINGLKRIKNDLATDCVKTLFKAKTFEEVIERANKARKNFEKLGCFRNINVDIDINNDTAATENGLAVTFQLDEMKSIIGGIQTLIGDNEGSLAIGFKIPNVCGRAEKITFDYTHGNKNTTCLNLSFIKPFKYRMSPVLTASIFQQVGVWPQSGYINKEKGILFDMTFPSFSKVRHSLQYEGVVREPSALERDVAFEVREQSGLHFKSALRHVLSADWRDACIFPTRGLFFRMTTEVAGTRLLGGNVSFLKNDTFIQLNIPVLEDVVVQCSATGGFIKPLNRNVGILDLYYLGGPQTVRGFEIRGIGPHVGGNAIGANVFWASAIHIFTGLPFFTGKGGFGDHFRFHAFYNMGNAKKIGVSRSSSENCMQISSAYGAGVAIKLGQMARVEFNYCIPVSLRKGDVSCPGLQFGIGLEYL